MKEQIQTERIKQVQNILPYQKQKYANYQQILKPININNLKVDQKSLKYLLLETLITKNKKALFQSLLTEDEQNQYEDRQIDEFQKVDLLGRLLKIIYRGGFSLVWKVKNINNNVFYAAKQILKQNTQSYKNELQIMKIIQDYFLQNKDDSLYLFIQGIQYFLKLFETKITKKDMWLIYEEGGQSLHKQFYNIQGKFINGTREYQILNNDLYQRMLQNPILLKQMITKLAQALSLLQELNIVHCDIKPENLLINYEQDIIKDIKIADFGSAYVFGENCQKMSTPEYLPPEMQSNKKNVQTLNHSTDVWSLGVILIEIVTGIPVWMTFKCQVNQGNQIVYKQGLFYAKGRCNEKILKKQYNLLEDFQNNIKKQWGIWQYIPDQNLLLDLIEKLVQLDPLLRLSPNQILKHPFLQ